MTSVGMENRKQVISLVCGFKNMGWLRFFLQTFGKGGGGGVGGQGS